MDNKVYLVGDVWLVLETGAFLEEAREESSSGVPHSLDICGVEDRQFHSEIYFHIP